MGMSLEDRINNEIKSIFNSVPIGTAFAIKTKGHSVPIYCWKVTDSTARWAYSFELAKKRAYGTKRVESKELVF